MGIVITPKLLEESLRISAKQADTWAPFVRAAAELAEINSEARVSAFLAQVGHESGRLYYTTELWGPTAQQRRYERDFAQPWADAGVNRLAFRLGNARPGDGSTFRGHGLIQVTGFGNHLLMTDSLRRACGNDTPNFVVAPRMLSQPLWAALSAAMFWKTKGLNRFADSGDFLALTKRINGGTNGLADRQALRASTLAALHRA